MKSKKALKNRYKEMKFPMGVFQIKNTANGKILVDGSLNMPAKWNRHIAQLKFGSHRNKALQQDWTQFGESQFTYKVLSELEYREDALDYNKEVAVLLEMYVEELQSFGEKGYNSKRSS